MAGKTLAGFWLSASTSLLAANLRFRTGEGRASPRPAKLYFLNLSNEASGRPGVMLSTFTRLPVNLVTERTSEGRLFLSTYPTMMNDRRQAQARPVCLAIYSDCHLMHSSKRVTEIRCAKRRSSYPSSDPSLCEISDRGPLRLLRPWQSRPPNTDPDAEFSIPCLEGRDGAGAHRARPRAAAGAARGPTRPCCG